MPWTMMLVEGKCKGMVVDNVSRENIVVKRYYRFYLDHLLDTMNFHLPSGCNGEYIFWYKKRRVKQLFSSPGVAVSLKAFAAKQYFIFMNCRNGKPSIEHFRSFDAHVSAMLSSWPTSFSDIQTRAAPCGSQKLYVIFAVHFESDGQIEWNGMGKRRNSTILHAYCAERFGSWQIDRIRPASGGKFLQSAKKKHYRWTDWLFRISATKLMLKRLHYEY